MQTDSSNPPSQRKRRSVEDRFWEKVDKAGPVPSHCPDLGPCWIWTGTRNGLGRDGLGNYGLFYLPPPGPRQVYAHRFSWELANGRSVPDGQYICHRCDNPSCINPSHLYAATPSENIQDALTKGRLPTGAASWPARNGEQRRGERNGMATLNAEQVKTIFVRYWRGEATQRQLAAEYNVTPPHISGIALGKFWGWLTNGLVPDGTPHPRRRWRYFRSGCGVPSLPSM
jgi:hypothetical protein